MTDLSLFSTKERSEEGAVLTVLDPTSGEPLSDDNGKSVTITLSGVDGAKYRECQNKIQNRRLKSIGRGKTKLELDAAELEKEGLELLASCTLGWSGIVWKGSELPFTVENAKMLYGELGWLREQVDSFIGERQNFFPKAVTSSSSTTAPL
jgi:hypothetical protein